MSVIALNKAFQKRAVVTKDGSAVLTAPLLTVVAQECGYMLPADFVDRAVQASSQPGFVNEEEFTSILAENKQYKFSTADVARSVLFIAPDGVITRGNLQEVFEQCPNSSNLSEEEIDSLFDVLDTKHTSKITSEDFMRALFGEDGVVALNEQRYLMTVDGAVKLSYDEKKRKEAARLAKEKADREAKEKADREAKDRDGKSTTQKAEKEKGGCC